MVARTFTHSCMSERNEGSERCRVPSPFHMSARCMIAFIRSRRAQPPNSLSAGTKASNLTLPKPPAPPGEHSQRRSRCVLPFGARFGLIVGLTVRSHPPVKNAPAEGRPFGGCRVGGHASHDRASEARSRRGRSPQEAALSFVVLPDLRVVLVHRVRATGKGL